LAQAVLVELALSVAHLPALQVLLLLQQQLYLAPVLLVQSALQHTVVVADKVVRMVRHLVAVLVVRPLVDVLRAELVLAAQVVQPLVVVVLVVVVQLVQAFSLELRELGAVVV
jgi:hypothetical protein